MLLLWLGQGVLSKRGKMIDEMSLWCIYIQYNIYYYVVRVNHVSAMCPQAMFSLCMLESEADEVTLQGVTSIGLKHALDFAYTGQVSLSSLHHMSVM